jgi:hypothetical protein
MDAFEGPGIYGIGYYVGWVTPPHGSTSKPRHYNRRDVVDRTRLWEVAAVAADQMIAYLSVASEEEAAAVGNIVVLFEDLQRRH